MNDEVDKDGSDELPKKILVHLKEECNKSPETQEIVINDEGGIIQFTKKLKSRIFKVSKAIGTFNFV